MNRLASILLLCIITSQANSQTVNPCEFYPSAVGNKWRIYSSVNDTTIDVEITRDSVGLSGERYLFYDNSPTPRWLVDTSCNVYQMIQGQPAIWYNFSTQPGDTFLSIHSGNTYRVRVLTSSGTVFGIPTDGLQFSWFWGTQTEPFARQSLLRGIGVVEWYADIGPTNDRVTGYRINGQTYGSLTHVSDLRPPTPRSLFLGQNYPNPFNPTTEIPYHLDSDDQVTLEVCDLLGRPIQTIVNEFKLAGSHRATFTADGLSSGIYLLRLRAGRHYVSRSIALVR